MRHAHELARFAGTSRKGKTVPTNDLARYIVDIPDYPEPGVIFKDITPLLASADGLALAVDQMAEHFAGAGITKVMVGSPVAYRLKAGFVPARKPGKLPRAVYSESYSLEYGTSELQVHQDALTTSDRVLIVDDLVATGGTAIATARLARQASATVVGFSFILELSYLNPRKTIAEDFPQEVFSLVHVS